MAVIGGVLLQALPVALFVVAAAQSRPIISVPGIRASVAGPIPPRVRACEEFYAWRRTRNPVLLDQAVGDAYSSRVPRQFASRFRTDLTGLRESVRMSAHSRTAISFKHAVQHLCRLVTGGTSRFLAQVRRAVAQFSRPGAATGRSAGQVPESGQKWNASP